MGHRGRLAYAAFLSSRSVTAFAVLRTITEVALSPGVEIIGRRRFEIDAYHSQRYRKDDLMEVSRVLVSYLAPKRGTSQLGGEEVASDQP